jgi:LemA protein
MVPLLIAFGVVCVIALVVVVWAVSIYNGLVTLRNRFKNAYAQIDVQLKRRYDLIPNLVEVAKGYIKHERETLEAVMAAADPSDPEAMKRLLQAEGSVGSTLGRLMMVSEAYPDLKANATMMQLSEELSSTENKVGFARQAYNDAVMAYNTQREVFPNVIIAGMANFQAAQAFEIENAAERQAPKVAFT